MRKLYLYISRQSVFIYTMSINHLSSYLEILFLVLVLPVTSGHLDKADLPRRSDPFYLHQHLSNIGNSTRPLLVNIHVIVDTIGARIGNHSNVYYFNSSFLLFKPLPTMKKNVCWNRLLHVNAYLKEYFQHINNVDPYQTVAYPYPRGAIGSGSTLFAAVDELKADVAFKLL